jgi:hypothetical protein
MIRAHLRYLRYVLLHKLYVFRAGVLINGYSLPWLWRLLVHDLSKFSRAEWRPYVCRFYGPPARELAEREVLDHKAAHHTEESWMDDDALAKVISIHTTKLEYERERKFQLAWLHHIHHNPHHWQHWILQQDDGRQFVLLPPHGAIINEMIADWIGAGQKINAQPTMMVCIAETIVWYVANASKMQLRQPVRHHVEETLVALAEQFHLKHLLPSLAHTSNQRSTIELAQ